ncbi:hypothetical protein CDAR_423661 [Caerostris darwini]|uniref:Uncharacterized protein n=1 Tax=Caerostris darwini TaxID=1538125 RepID=A0AAV4VB59_9ARAC|nr:hypothetical protein CDAR_423661 [Caerostris darwini]
MQMPEIFHERGCSNESSDVTAAVAKRVSNWKGCDCDKECGTRYFLEVSLHNGVIWNSSRALGGFRAIHSGAERVISPTDVHAKAAGWASIHTDSTADKELRLINMGS